VKELAGKEMVKGIRFNSADDLAFCCVKGKQHRASFSKSSDNRAKQVLDLVHLDLCGPIGTTSLGGKRYFLGITDDYSRKCQKESASTGVTFVLSFVLSERTHV
jgi:hypothetical protein